MFASYSLLAAAPACIMVERGAEAMRMAWVRIGSNSLVDLGVEGMGNKRGYESGGSGGYEWVDYRFEFQRQTARYKGMLNACKLKRL